ncbi:translation initiation factor IF-2-like isoform X2 [Helicoverpa zea]|uniref:translation initiation factor IF-2-like isoform X2 n=1 Tax=Helicoverpa zea TaxID=7113 RepID=UPI001F577CD0|nr:translation initiation factor IF-2-like isoform X2 [Helicoverpa zea]
MWVNPYQEFGTTPLLTDEVPVLILGFIEMEVERLNSGASYNTIDIFDEYVDEVPIETETASSMPLSIEPASSMPVPPEPASSVPVPTEPASSQATQQPEQAAPRRRRRRRRQEVDAEPEEQSTLRTATDMLQNIEVASSNATNRLAAAIESLAARLSEPIRIELEQPASTTGT